VEKCEKRWQSNHRTAVRQEAQNAVYSVAGGARAWEMRACSACAGDYEDPERTAWTPDDAEDGEHDGAPGVNAEEFPAEE
jgi:hypothetical protein